MEKMFKQLLQQMKELTEQLQYQSTQLQQQNEQLTELQGISFSKGQRAIVSFYVI